VGSGPKPSLETERVQRATSYGLAQCLGETLRWCVKSKLPFLTAYCDPELGIDAGCQILRYYLDKAKGNYREALKGYNGSYAYADKVLERVRVGEHKRFFQGGI
jgi:soluble lytic murein transglycosylase-like protein